MASPQTQWVEPAQGRKHKLPRMKNRDWLDRLIDWYEKNKPDMPHVMPGGIAMDREELVKFAAQLGGDTWTYRGWTLKQAEPVVVKKMKIHR